MLDLINKERDLAGVPRVTLGNNPAAQIHAEAASEGCFSGHWGLDGLNHIMRYGLAGGYQANAENVSGLPYCIKPWENFTTIRNINTEIRESMAGLMGSPGHRRTILDPLYAKVNIGLAWDSYILTTVQQFEGDFVSFKQEPQLSNSALTMSGAVRNGPGFSKDTDLAVSVYYHPPPHPLTLGQLSRRGCAGPGLLVTSLRPPAPPGSFYPSDTFFKSYTRCPSPYDIPPDTPAPDSYRAAKLPYISLVPPSAGTFDWTTADDWKADGTDFAISADLGPAISEHGPGVYVVFLWARLEGESALVSGYPIFHDIPRPTGYD